MPREDGNFTKPNGQPLNRRNKGSTHKLEKSVEIGHT